MVQAAFSTVEIDPTVGVLVRVHFISRVIVLAQEKVEENGMSIFEHAAQMAATTEVRILTRRHAKIWQRW